MAEQHKLILPTKHLWDFLENKIRLDGRKFTTHRPVGLNTNSFINSLGSSAVKIGKSNVVCGIRAELAKPNTLTSSRGYIIPNIDMSFLSMCSNTSTRSNYDFADMITCLVYDILVDSQCLNLEDLCVQKGKLVWALYIDVICLEIDGALLDAVIMACVAALNNLRLPNIFYDDTTDKIDVESNKDIKLKLKAYPVISTYCTFEEVLIMDPSSDEELNASALFHIGMSNDSVSMLYKSGGAPVRKQDIDISLSNTLQRKNEIKKLICSILKE